MTCLSVCRRRRQCPIERGDPLEMERHRNSEAQIRTLLDNQKEQILAECQARINQHEFQAARAEELQRRDQQLLHARLLQQNSELREAHEKSLNEIEEIKKFQSSTFDTFAIRRLVEDQDTILEVQNEINCMNDSRDFQDAQSVRSGNSHVTSQPAFFPPHPVPGGMLGRSIGMPSRKDGRQAFGTRMVFRETFLQVQLCLLQHLIRRN